MASSPRRPSVDISAMRKISRQLGADISRLKKGIDEAVNEAEAALDKKAERDGLGDFSMDNLREAWVQLDPGQVKGLEKLRKERNGSQEHIREELRLMILALDQFEGKDAKKYRERMAQALQWQAEIDDIAAETDQLQTRVEWLKEMESEMEKQKNTPERQMLRSRIDKQWETDSDNRQERMHLIEEWVLSQISSFSKNSRTLISSSGY